MLLADMLNASNSKGTRLLQSHRLPSDMPCAGCCMLCKQGMPRIALQSEGGVHKAWAAADAHVNAGDTILSHMHVEMFGGRVRDSTHV